LNKKIYNDGDEVENYILSIYKNNTSKEKIDDILNDNPSWPVKYHLSSDRHNLLSWYNFKENSSLLEIGAGCGAITGLFLDKGLDVTAVELSKRRADIIRTRFRKSKKLKVLDGDINEKDFSQKFDYATLIGVLEYAGKYGKGEDPFLEMIRDAKKYLKKGGVLIIAIGNRFGLKYWRGVPEDHTNILFDSLEGYPDYQGIRTFGKKELTDLLINSGFKEEKISFYYPLPDYKFCYEVFSDRYLPTKEHRISNGIYPSPHPTKSYHLFDEKLVARGLQENNLFEEFANSFLVFVKNE
jgi:SAM-dependent methyltransferase